MAVALLDELQQLDVQLSVQDGKLRLNAPGGVLDDALTQRIRDCKAELLALLDPSPARAPLSFGQQRFWFQSRLSPQSPAFALAVGLDLIGELNSDALQQALLDLRQQHPVLASRFPEIDGIPQCCPDTQPWSLQRIEMDGSMDAAQFQAQFQAQLQAESLRLLRRPLNLETGPVMTATLLALPSASEGDAGRRHRLLLQLHHIVFDGRSWQLFCAHLATAYAQRCAGVSEPPQPPCYSYANYAAAQQRQRDNARQQQLLGWWRQQFTPLPETVELPADFPRPAVQVLDGALARFMVPAGLRQSLAEYAASHGATPFMAWCSLFALLLGRLSQVDEVVIGIPASLRDRAELEPLVGNFVNTLPLRIALHGEQGFAALLAQVRATVLAAYEHRDLPFERLVSELDLRHDTGRSPLVSFMFDLQQMRVSELQLPGLEVNALDLDRGTAVHDLSLFLVQEQQGLQASIEYSTALFEPSRMQRLEQQLLTLAKGALADPARPVARLGLLSAAEFSRVVVDWNATASEFDQRQCLSRLFSAQAQRTPDASAIIDGHERISYRQLAQQTDALAAHLQQLGADGGVRVGIFLARGWRALLAVMAVLRSGAAYVSLDPGYPEARVAATLEDAEPALIISDSSLRARLPSTPASVLDLDQLMDSSAATPLQPLPDDAERLAYLVYTSGSTGRPKGVAVSHRNVAALVHWSRSQVSDEELRGSLLSASLSFDLSVYELFVPLTRGGSLIVAENALALATLPAREQVTMLTTVPSAVDELLAAGSIPDSVRVINLCGELLRQQTVDGLYAQTAVQRVYDLYGPSEDTVCSTGFVRSAAGVARVGKPILNSQAYILDRNQQPLPIGVPGELYLSGEGVTRGYWRQPQMTEQCFPVVSLASDGQAVAARRMYRTGDRMQWRADGNLEFLGRADHQVKLRGYRVELGEVSTVLEQHPSVAAAVAVAPNDGDGAKRLLAFVELQPGLTVQVAELQEWVRQRLPAYMVPTLIELLQALPRNANGKLDRKALPLIEAGAVTGAGAAAGSEQGSVSAAAPRAPRDRLEAHLVKLWEELLQTAPIGIDDDFFARGGHSLLAARLIDRVAKHFGRRLPLDSLWVGEPTVAAMARLLRLQDDTHWATLVEMKRGEGGAPLFCVHTEGGNLYHYFPLAAALPAQQAVYGLQARGTYANSGFDSTLADMATHCVDTMLAKQPQGPWNIAGFSSGGIFAFEMAQRLVAAGHPPPRLMLLDAFSPGVVPRRGLRKRVAELGNAGHRGYHREHLKQRLSTVLRRRRPEQFPNAASAHRWAQWSYRPARYEGPVTLFLSEASRHHHADEALGWSRFCTRLTIEPLPGGHSSIVKYPQESGLAGQLQKLISR